MLQVESQVDRVLQVLLFMLVLVAKQHTKRERSSLFLQQLHSLRPLSADA